MERTKCNIMDEEENMEVIRMKGAYLQLKCKKFLSISLACALDHPSLSYAPPLHFRTMINVKY